MEGGRETWKQGSKGWGRHTSRSFGTERREEGGRVSVPCRECPSPAHGTSSRDTTLPGTTVSSPEGPSASGPGAAWPGPSWMPRAAGTSSELDRGHSHSPTLTTSAALSPGTRYSAWSHLRFAVPRVRGRDRRARGLESHPSPPPRMVASPLRVSVPWGRHAASLTHC